MWKKLVFQLPTLRALKSIDQSQSRLAGSGAISNCVESFCFLSFFPVSWYLPRGGRPWGGSLCRERGICLHYMLGVQGCVTWRCWFSPWLTVRGGFAQDEELRYEVSKQWFPMTWLGVQYSQEIGAVGKQMLMEKGLSVLIMSREHFSVHAASARSKFSFRVERENISILYTKTYDESKA